MEEQIHLWFTKITASSRVAPPALQGSNLAATHSCGRPRAPGAAWPRFGVQGSFTSRCLKLEPQSFGAPLPKIREHQHQHQHHITITIANTARPTNPDLHSLTSQRLAIPF